MTDGPVPQPERHPTHGLDDTVHQRARLGILAVLHESAKVDFTFLRDTLDLTAGNLSRHLQVLEEAGLVVVDKGYEGRRARTWVRSTKAGHDAFRAEIDRLKELIRRVDGAGDLS
ncbi:winged helix-turn-helix domain-containing protein [Streptacidiphilus jiangxiensis]|uniref:Winged helix DNA-binding domain-containing protein n=1 Tax=Streptacidiphilus jiangxiensis TaxID=235985 RepID=A0A1H7HN11_STRJI|nr:transcriptional regulator [Streptacidiphilus jiangxiensis]SEK50400.1 Winged helix DNA-binding domain-containing protein [Streptacidiphilus jiangxiensis]